MNVDKRDETDGCDISILFVLMAPTRNGQEEDNDPRDSDLCPHLEVNRANARVQASTHKDIVNEIAGHANLVTSCDGEEVHSKGDCKPVYHRNGHDMTIVGDDFCEPEDVKIVEQSSSDHRDVDGPESIAVVRQRLVSKRRDWESFLLVTWHNPSEKELIDDETGVNLPGIAIRTSILGEIKRIHVRDSRRLTSRR